MKTYNPSKIMVLVLILALALSMLAACTPANTLPAPGQEGPVQGAPPMDDTRLANPLPDQWTVRGGEVPAEFIEQAKADLAARRSIESGEIEVIRAESVTYNDGSLGCPSPDEMYTMALVDGYRVVLYYDTIEFDYRLSDTGALVMCDLPQP
jgi:hypothetical protein